MDIYSLNRGATYTVVKQFSDYYGNAFAEGEKLTFVEKHFLPYHGGHTIVFKERNLYLQEEANADILDSFGEYFSCTNNP